MLTSAAAALAAPPLPAAVPDPTLPLYEAWAEALRLTETLANIWAEKPVEAPMDPELIAAYDHCDALAAQLLATRPTTLPGLIAKLRCIQEHLTCREDMTFLEVVIGDVRWMNPPDTGRHGGTQRNRPHTHACDALPHHAVT